MSQAVNTQRTLRRGPTANVAARRAAVGIAALSLSGLVSPSTADASPDLAGLQQADEASASASVSDPRSATSCYIPSSRNVDVTAAVYDEGRALGVSGKLMLAGFETGWVESHMNNLLCGTYDSLGVFQQRPSQGWGTTEQVLDVRNAAHSFFTRAKRADAACPSCTAGQIAQRVQVSAHPDRYDAVKSTASSLISEAARNYAVQPFDAVGLCGSGFRIVDKQNLSTVGATYLLWKGSVSQNCVVTLRTANTSTATTTSAKLQPDGYSSPRSDSGSYRFYAGPIRLSSPNCVRWGGSIGSQRYFSGPEHCS